MVPAGRAVGSEDSGAQGGSGVIQPDATPDQPGDWESPGTSQSPRPLNCRRGDATHPSRGSACSSGASQDAMPADRRIEAECHHPASLLAVCARGPTRLSQGRRAGKTEPTLPQPRAPTPSRLQLLTGLGVHGPHVHFEGAHQRAAAQQVLGMNHLPGTATSQQSGWAGRRLSRGGGRGARWWHHLSLSGDPSLWVKQESICRAWGLGVGGSPRLRSVPLPRPVFAGGQDR